MHLESVNRRSSTKSRQRLKKNFSIVIFFRTIMISMTTWQTDKNDNHINIIFCGLTVTSCAQASHNILVIIFYQSECPHTTNHAQTNRKKLRLKLKNFVLSLDLNNDPGFTENKSCLPTLLNHTTRETLFLLC